MNNFQEFFNAYMEAIIWADSPTDDNGREFFIDIDDIDPECVDAAAVDCQKFLELAGEITPAMRRASNYRDVPILDAESAMTQAGHDFWLTRNHHGAGFWDGDWTDEAGERLTKIAQSFPEQSLYVGDDGWTYIGPA